MDIVIAVSIGGVIKMGHRLRLGAVREKARVKRVPLNLAAISSKLLCW